MSNTLQTFWHDATSGCEMEPRRLMELYAQLTDHSTASQDQFSNLLIHQMRKNLITVLANKLEEAFVTQTLNNNRELNRILKDLHEIDKRVSQAIWERAINEIYLFIDSEEIIDQLMRSKIEEIQVFGLQYLLNKYRLEIQSNEYLYSLLTYHLSSLLKSKTLKASTVKTTNHIYNHLPQELRLLYESAKHKIGLLNYGHWEYLYAPRGYGPDNERRTPLTWTQKKNSTDSDCYLLPKFNSKGLIAFGSRFGASTKYLYADIEQEAAYFWIGAGTKSSQWWHVLWPHALFSKEGGHFLIFQNSDTKELLCATTEYDEYRRYVTLLNTKDNMKNSACQWLVKAI